MPFRVLTSRLRGSDCAVYRLSSPRRRGSRGNVGLRFANPTYRTVTPDMALRLSRAFDTTPDLWMNLQKSFDLWEASHASKAWKGVKQLPSDMIHSHA